MSTQAGLKQVTELANFVKEMQSNRFLSFVVLKDR